MPDPLNVREELDGTVEELELADLVIGLLSGIVDRLARLEALAERIDRRTSEAEPYPGPHDDCMATTPHYHDRPYRVGDWT